MATKKKQLKVKLIKSKIAAKPSHKECVRGLGLRKIHQTVILQDNPCIRGMIDKVNYLLSVEEI